MNVNIVEFINKMAIFYTPPSLKTKSNGKNMKQLARRHFYITVFNPSINDPGS